MERRNPFRPDGEARFRTNRNMAVNTSAPTRVSGTASPGALRHSSGIGCRSFGATCFHPGPGSNVVIFRATFHVSFPRSFW